MPECEWFPLTASFAPSLVAARRGTPAMEDWQRSAPRDAYHSLTWQVRDLGQVADVIAYLKSLER